MLGCPDLETKSGHETFKDLVCGDPRQVSLRYCAVEFSNIYHREE
jgi:hypothetical protein